MSIEVPAELLDALREHLRKFHPFVETGNGRYVWFTNVHTEPTTVGEINQRQYEKTLCSLGLANFPGTPPYGIEGQIEPWMSALYLRQDAEDFYRAGLELLYRKFGEDNFVIHSDTAQAVEAYYIQETVEAFYEMAQQEGLIH